MISAFASLWAWIKRRLSDPVALLAFLLALALGGLATFAAFWISALGGLAFALAGIPVIFGLASFVPRVGGALSLGGNLGAALVLGALLV
ncbi:MAG: hypothetical protein ACOZAM_31280 [Pseudomonadota bacterium]